MYLDKSSRVCRITRCDQTCSNVHKCIINMKKVFTVERVRGVVMFIYRYYNVYLYHTTRTSLNSSDDDCINITPQLGKHLPT